MCVDALLLLMSIEVHTGRYLHATLHLSGNACKAFKPMLCCCACVRLQERLNSNYAELSGAFKTSLEGLARTVQDLHSIIK